MPKTHRRRAPAAERRPADGMMAALTAAATPTEEDRMGVYIIREMVGTSPRSWSDAARQAVATASKTVRNIQTVEVVKSTAVVEDGEIVEYRVELKIGFEYEG
jgi:flavin-binding protein dodecin